jgi:protein phosphatase 2C family protein 2/3
MGQILDKPVTEKQTHNGGNNFLLYGCSSMQGYRISMEDRHNYVADINKDLKDAPAEIKNLLKTNTDTGLSFFAVYDGHSGDSCADFLSKNLLKNILAEEVNHNTKLTPETLLKNDDVIKKGFMRTDAEFEKASAGVDDSGTTAVTALVKKNKDGKIEVICVNTGDSRAVAYINGKTEAMSFDHKPTNQTERERILKADSFVEFGRVSGTLAVSRAFGDLSYKKCSKVPPEAQAVTALPDIKRVVIEPEDYTNNNYSFLLLACDGLWDVMTNEQATSYVLECLKKQKNGTYQPSNNPDNEFETSQAPKKQGYDLGMICEELLDHSVKVLDSKDNVSIVIVLFGQNDA